MVDYQHQRCSRSLHSFHTVSSFLICVHSGHGGFSGAALFIWDTQVVIQGKRRLNFFVGLIQGEFLTKVSQISDRLHQVISWLGSGVMWLSHPSLESWAQCSSFDEYSGEMSPNSCIDDNMLYLDIAIDIDALISTILSHWLIDTVADDPIPPGWSHRLIWHQTLTLHKFGHPTCSEKHQTIPSGFVFKYLSINSTKRSYKTVLHFRDSWRIQWQFLSSIDQILLLAVKISSQKPTILMDLRYPDISLESCCWPSVTPLVKGIIICCRFKSSAANGNTKTCAEIGQLATRNMFHASGLHPRKPQSCCKPHNQPFSSYGC